MGTASIVPESADDDATRQVIVDIAACAGTVPDRSGKPGVDLPRAEAFFAACEAFDTWIQKAEAGAANILPLGSATAGAAAAVQAIRSKVNDYFGRCRLAAYDARALAHLNRREEEYLTVAAQDLSITGRRDLGLSACAGRPRPAACRWWAERIPHTPSRSPCCASGR
jgi:hypothetical protein